MAIEDFVFHFQVDYSYIWSYNESIRMLTKIVCLLLSLHVLGNAWAKAPPTITCLQEETHCGNSFCCCLGVLARCSRLWYTLTYIPELPSYITRLHFTYNNLRTLSRSMFQNIAKLSIEELDLSGNKILRLAPDTFEELRYLSKLSLNQNRNINKTELSLALGSIQKVNKLETLALDNTGFTDLTDSFFLPMNGSQVMGLCLSKNMLKSVNISALCFLPFLRKLKLRKNHIQNFKASYGHRRLKDLVLTENEIEREVPQFCSEWGERNLYPQLHKLYLDANKISEIIPSTWGCLKHLKLLDLRMNGLGKIPNNVFCMLTSLKELRINKLVTNNMNLSPLALNNSRLEKLTLGRDSMMFETCDVNNTNLESFVGPFYFGYSLNMKYINDSSGSYVLQYLQDKDVKRLLPPLVKLKNLHMDSWYLSVNQMKLFAFLENNRLLVLDEYHITNYDDAFDVQRSRWSGANSQLINLTFPFRLSSEIRLNRSLAGMLNITNYQRWFQKSRGKGVRAGINITLLNWSKPVISQRSGPILLNSQSTEKSCQENRTAVLFIYVLGSLLLLTFIVTPLLYKYRWYISYLLYRWKQKPDLPNMRPLLGNRPPYTYVIYSDEDRHFVHHDFRQLVEEDFGFNLYIWHRDADVDVKANVMYDGIHRSSHVVGIVSKKFISDTWCEFQLDVASHLQIERKEKFLTLVMLEDTHKALLERSWSARLTRLKTLYWYSDLRSAKEDIRKKVFDRQLKKRVKSWTLISGKPLP